MEESKQKLEQQTRTTEQFEKKQGKCIDMIRKLLLEKVCSSSCCYCLPPSCCLLPCPLRLS